MSSNTTLKNLRNLTRQAPGGEDLDRMFSELKEGQSDRAAALIAGAQLEGQLQFFIQEGFFIKLNSEEHDQIFSGIGPLSNFSSMIKVGYAMGLYNKETRRDLDLIKDIRNCFAHAQKHITFETPEVAKCCSMLSGFKDSPGFFNPADSGPRNCYISHTMNYSHSFINNAFIRIAKKDAEMKLRMKALSDALTNVPPKSSPENI